MRGKVAYIVADIEGSTGVWTKAHTQRGREWQEARVELTFDINAVGEALLERGVRQVIVKDWHRTGFNIIPAYLDPRIQLISGYYAGPALGYGNLYGANFALLVGLHASSGNTKGFLPHTLTSRIAEIRVNGNRVCESELFATVLADFKIPVSFFSGCPAACEEVKERMPWVVTQAIAKDPDIYQNPEMRREYIRRMRRGFKAKIGEIPDHPEDLPLFRMEPPFDCRVIFHDENQARKMNPWGFPREGNVIHFHSDHFLEFYENLLKISYFSQWTFRLRSLALPLSRIVWKIQSLKHL